LFPRKRKKHDKRRCENMNKKTLLIALMALTVILLAMPVMAVPTENGQVVAASQLTIGSLPPTYILGQQTDGIKHLSGNEYYFGVLTIDEEDYYIYSYNDVNSVWNTKNGLLITKTDLAWYVTDTPSTVEETSDGFAGTGIYLLNSFNGVTYSSIRVHILAHGFGIFEGQTLEFSYAGETNGVWSGICVKG
jgi:hypothetical protein